MICRSGKSVSTAPANCRRPRRLQAHRYAAWPARNPARPCPPQVTNMMSGLSRRDPVGANDRQGCGPRGTVGAYPARLRRGSIREDRRMPAQGRSCRNVPQHRCRSTRQPLRTRLRLSQCVSRHAVLSGVLADLIVRVVHIDAVGAGQKHVMRVYETPVRHRGQCVETEGDRTAPSHAGDRPYRGYRFRR